MSLRIVCCPHCQNQMRVPRRGSGFVVTCPTCKNQVSVDAKRRDSRLLTQSSGSQSTGSSSGIQPSHLSSSANSGSRPRVMEYNGFVKRPAHSKKGWVIAISLLVSVVLLTAIGAGIYFFVSHQSKQRRQADNVAGSRSQSKELDSDKPSKQKTETASKQFIGSKRSPTKQQGQKEQSGSANQKGKGRAPTGKSGDQISSTQSSVDSRNRDLHFRLEPHKNYEFQFSLDARIQQTDFSFFGVNSLRAVNAQASSDQIQSIDFSAFVKNVTRTASKSGQMGKLDSGLGIPGAKGRLEIDNSGECSTKVDLHLLPWLMQPVGLIGVERVEPFQTSWSNREQYVLEGSQPSLAKSIEESLDTGSLYRQARSGKSLSGKTSSGSANVVRIETDYRVVSKNENEIKVKKSTIVELFQDSKSTEPITALSASGHFIFDKRQDVVSYSILEGDVEIKLTDGRVSVPVKFEVRLKSMQ